AVRAVQVHEQPALGRFHEQVLVAADVTAVEADIAGTVAPEHHAGPVQRNLGDEAAAARHDEPGRLEARFAGIRDLYRIRRKGLLSPLLPDGWVVTQMQRPARLF